MATRARGWEIVERVRAGERLIFDGGYGTALFDAGLENGDCPELWNDTHPDVVRGIHRGYFDAGSQLVETNTFGGTALKLHEYDERYGHDMGARTRELNDKGARLARAACPPGGYVAGSIGPTSYLPLDYGVGKNVATDEEYFETFREQAQALAAGGVDCFAVETMMFPLEAAAAIRACKAVADLPVMATMFFQYEELHDRDRTMWGDSPADVARQLLDAGADIVGMNCGRGPDRAIVIIREMRAGHRRAAHRVPERGPADHHRRPDHLRARPGGDGQGLPGAARRGVQHRGRLLRLESGAHPPHRRRGALPPRAVTAPAFSLLSRTPVVLEGLPLSIDRDEVLRFQGYQKGVDLPSPVVVAIFEEALALGERLMAPRLVYRAAPVDERGADLIAAGGERLAIPQIGRLWGPIEAVGAGICTVGEAIETRVRALFDAREFPLAVMLDSVGSAAAESLAEYANDLLCQAALPQGLKVTNRVSPGYAGWDTAEQARLFRICPGDPIGVRAQRGVLHDPGQVHQLAGRARAGGAGGPLLHPVPALLDARLRLPPGPRRRHGAAARRGGVVIGWRSHGRQRGAGGVHGRGQILGGAAPRPPDGPLLRRDRRHDHRARGPLDPRDLRRARRGALPRPRGGDGAAARAQVG